MENENQRLDTINNITSGVARVWQGVAPATLTFLWAYENNTERLA